LFTQLKKLETMLIKGIQDQEEVDFLPAQTRQNFMWARYICPAHAWKCMGLHGNSNGPPFFLSF